MRPEAVTAASASWRRQLCRSGGAGSALAYWCGLRQKGGAVLAMAKRRAGTDVWLLGASKPRHPVRGNKASFCQTRAVGLRTGSD